MELFAFGLRESKKKFETKFSKDSFTENSIQQTNTSLWRSICVCDNYFVKRK